ncbi:hypothetical protein RZS08_61365, partial [Arthrospira platensis SPKY1]|nr:hypothetical protein [Arthrospira platensis SPKY1]
MYPNKDLPGFLQRNNIAEYDIKSSELLTKMISDGNNEIVEQDVEGGFHFNGNFKNAGDLEYALNSIIVEEYHGLAEKEKDLILDIFE